LQKTQCVIAAGVEGVAVCATTTPAGNVTGGVEVFSGSTLNLGADMTLTNNLDIRDGSTVDAQNHAITANQLLVGFFDTNSEISLNGGSVLTVAQTGGTGLTLNGTTLSSLTIDPSSMDLILTLNSGPELGFPLEGSDGRRQLDQHAQRYDRQRPDRRDRAAGLPGL
jgi:hypothetical protein